MTQVTFDLPVEITESLRVPAAEQQQRLRMELGVRLYQKELLSFGKARELAGLTKWEFHELLADEGIVGGYDTEELEWDLEALERLD